jgi:hypothetical protein
MILTKMDNIFLNICFCNMITNILLFFYKDIKKMNITFRIIRLK